MAEKPTIRELEERIKALESDLDGYEELKNQLKQSLSLNNALFNRVRDCVYICDKVGNFLDANDTALKLMGYAREDIQKLNFADIVHPRDLPFVYERTIEILEKGYQDKQIELELIRKDGATVMVETISSIMFIDGESAAIMGIARDITVRKAAETVVLEGEERFRFFSEQSLMAIAIFQNNRLIYINRVFTDISGYAMEEMIQWPYPEILHLVHPEDREFVMWQEKIKSEKKPGWTAHYSCRIITKSGAIRWIDQYSKYISLNGEMATFLTAVDITARIEAEKALKETEAFHRLVTEYAADIIWIRETDETFKIGPITFISPSVERIRGYSVEEAKTLTMEENMPPSSIKVFHKVLQEEKEREYYHKTDFNRTRTVEVELVSKDGSLKWFEITMRIIRDASGKPIHFLGISRDIHERRELQQQALESAKMAALGGLVAGVAHEINTPIGVSITASTYLNDMVRRFDSLKTIGQTDPEKLKAIFRKIEETSGIIHRNLKHAVEIISSFKQVAVDQSTEGWRLFHVKKTIDDILVNLEPRLKRTRHKITITCGEKLTLYSSPGTFFQIISNLVMNSLIHGFADMESGHILMEIKEQEKEILFLYSDDGAGMEPQVQERIFEPFFTTKRGQGGTGLGLHIVYNLVTQTLGGAIKCKSTPGKGSDFLIAIPRMDISI
jgi:PAS domain S-box-containing protein